MAEIDFNKVGDRIRSARLEHGLTQSQLAEKVGLSYAWVSQLEKGKKLPLETLMKFCDVLGKDPNYFLMDTEYVPEKVVMNREISKKLRKLNRSHINFVNSMLDLLIEQSAQDEKKSSRGTRKVK